MQFPKVAAVGHNMGARLLSGRFSAGAVDLYIGLQGAFITRRFIVADSGEGVLYVVNIDRSIRILPTSSDLEFLSFACGSPLASNRSELGVFCSAFRKR